MEALPADAMGGMSADMMEAMPADAMGGMDAPMMEAMPADAMGGMSAAHDGSYATRCYGWNGPASMMSAMPPVCHDWYGR